MQLPTPTLAHRNTRQRGICTFVPLLCKVRGRLGEVHGQQLAQAVARSLHFLVRQADVLQINRVDLQDVRGSWYEF